MFHLVCHFFFFLHLHLRTAMCTYEHHSINSLSFGTYMHMMWDCPSMKTFWSQVAKSVSRIVGAAFSPSLQYFIVEDDSSLTFTVPQKRVWLSGRTEAKRMLMTRRKPPHLTQHNSMATKLL